MVYTLQKLDKYNNILKYQSNSISNIARVEIDKNSVMEILLKHMHIIADYFYKIKP